MHCKRFGFGRLEWIVVIGCAVILLALLLPAMNATRGPGRVSQCNAQMQCLALATIQYHNSRGALPGYVMDFGRG